MSSPDQVPKRRQSGTRSVYPPAPSPERTYFGVWPTHGPRVAAVMVAPAAVRLQPIRGLERRSWVSDDLADHAVAGQSPRGARAEPIWAARRLDDMPGYFRFVPVVS